MNVNVACFWIYHFSGLYVQIALRRGHKVEFTKETNFDEGFSVVHESYQWPEDEEYILSEISENWHDCDGPGRRFTDFTCPLDKLKVIEPYQFEDEDERCPENLPDWQKTACCVYDAYAEAMGY